MPAKSWSLSVTTAIVSNPGRVINEATLGLTKTCAYRYIFIPVPHLIVVEPDHEIRTVTLTEHFRVGRHPQNDLVLFDSRVSRQHVRFEHTARGWEVIDLGSAQGMLVNGVRGGASHVLTDGDSIQIGAVLLTFSTNEPSPDVIERRVETATIVTGGAPGVDRRIKLVHEAARAAASIGDTELFLRQMLDAVLDLFGCERAFVGLGDDPNGPVKRILRARESAKADEIVVSRTLLDAMLTKREGVVVRNAKEDLAPRTVLRQNILCAMGVPLQTASRVFGFLYVDDRRQAERFRAEDLDFLIAIGYLVGTGLENAERYQRAAALAATLDDQSPTAEIIGTSPPMVALKAQIVKYAAAPNAHVLVRGESGSGKELVARALHTASPRHDMPFVTLNCAAIPDNMVESELFGYDKGAFTGAVKPKRGKFVLADKGTLFLDEIGDLDLAAQAKLLRAIQEGEVQPLGSERAVHVNVRIVAATHKDLRQEIEEKRFREDLYYRLAVVEINVPPLRERPGDVELLAEALLKTSASAMGKHLDGFSTPALEALARHVWPGNVRELRNEVERAAINAEGRIVEFADLSPPLRFQRPNQTKAVDVTEPPKGLTFAQRFAALEPMEKQIVQEALAAAKGNVSEAARLLGVTRIVIRRRLERFGILGQDD